MRNTRKRFLDENELAEMFGLSVRTIRRSRLVGRGPRFRKLGGTHRAGAVRYASEDVEEWIEGCPAGGEQPEARPAA